MMTEIQTIDGGQKDALLRKAHINNKNHTKNDHIQKRQQYMLTL